LNPSAENFYAVWRRQCRAADALRDENDFPAERLLQAIWQHQRLRRDQLHTPEGKTVRVLHPGFVSTEGGPDFRGAIIQIGGEPPRSGDVEIDLRSHGWHAHGHDRNPNFKQVILHVVWETGAPASGPAQNERPLTLLIKDSLDAPLGELSQWLESESAAAFPEKLRGKCSAPLSEFNEPQLAGLLHQAARVRLESKAAQFSARARHAGWEQALWEGLFRVLGYKHNAWPMQNLAESRLLWSPGAKSPFVFQTRLLGVSGLLPGDLIRLRSAPRNSGAARPMSKNADDYIRQLWDVWWRERDTFGDCTLPRAVWKFHGLRPANHPQRRLALSAHWLADKNFISKIEKWCAADLADSALPGLLLEILQVERDEFWSWHWTFRSARLAKPQPLLGGARAADLAVNAILPWLWVRAAEGKNAALRREIERRYFAWPAAEDNSVLKLARQRLLGTASRRARRSAAEQQGLMQIVRDFCDHSNAICDECHLPALAGEFRAAAGGADG
jgi:hypothetical protein